MYFSSLGHWGPYITYITQRKQYLFEKRIKTYCDTIFCSHVHQCLYQLLFILYYFRHSISFHKISTLILKIFSAVIFTKNDTCIYVYPYTFYVIIMLVADNQLSWVMPSQDSLLLRQSVLRWLWKLECFEKTIHFCKQTNKYFLRKPPPFCKQTNKYFLRKPSTFASKLTNIFLENHPLFADWLIFFTLGSAWVEIGQRRVCVRGIAILSTQFSPPCHQGSLVTISAYVVK